MTGWLFNTPSQASQFWHSIYSEDPKSGRVPMVGKVGLGPNHSKTGLLGSLDHSIHEEKLYVYTELSRLIDHLKPGIFCPVFEW